MAKINCPLMGGEIDDVICFDIHMVAEHMAPEWTAPKEAVQKSDFRKICLECPNHRED